MYISNVLSAAIWPESSVISQTAHFLFKHTKPNVFDERGPFLMKTYSMSGSWEKWDFVAKLWTPKNKQYHGIGRRGEKKIWAQPQRAGKALELFCLQFTLTLSLSHSIVHFFFWVSFSTTEQEMRKTLGQGVNCFYINVKLSCMCGIYHIQ